MTHARLRRIWDLGGDGHDKEDPGLGVPETLLHLVRLEVVVLDPLAVRRDPLDGDYPLGPIGEEGARRQVRHGYQKHDAPGQADGVEDEEFVHPLPERGARADVSDGVPEQTAEDARHAVHAVVRHKPQQLLGAPVPHGHDQDEARVDDGLGDAQQEAVGGDANKVCTCWSRDHEDTPG